MPLSLEKGCDMGTIAEAVKASPHVRILVVADNSAIRHLMGTVLGEEGFDVEEAVDGADALGKLGTSVYDAIVSDLEMPRLDGLSLLQEIRRRGIGTPVIIQTAGGDALLESALWRAGALRVLSKGQFEELLQSLREAIGTSKPAASGYR
jgi:CheY-like chemotaxis protein